MKKLTLTQPDDWHLHLRDGLSLKTTVSHTAERFARAIIMPNIKPPIINAEMATAYRERILAALPDHTSFQPLMTLYLTDLTNADTVIAAKNTGFIKAFKLYPAGATTNSQAGVTDIKKIYPAIEAMEEYNLPLLIHGEVTNANIDIFDRETHFINEHFIPLLQRFPKLRMVFEHITTADAVEFVLGAPDTIAATITAHHLLLNRNDMLAGGIRPHYYCLPIIKRKSHQEALINAAISGNKKFFLGSDSAPHAVQDKESACGCAGIYTSHAAIELYAEAFEQANALMQLEGFASWYGADFYGLPRNKTTITLHKNPWQVPHEIEFGDQKLIPMRAGKTINWAVEK